MRQAYGVGASVVKLYHMSSRPRHANARLSGDGNLRASLDLGRKNAGTLGTEDIRAEGR